MSVEARRATGAALRVTSESFAIATPAGDAERRCRRALLEEWVGRETAVVPAAAVAARARSGRRGAARPRRPARGAAADQRRRRRRAGDRGGAHRRQRLRPGAGLGPEPAGVAAGGLRAAGGGDPRPAAAPRGHAGAPAAGGGARRALAGADRRLDAARARTASRWRRRSAGRRGWDGWSRRSMPGRPRGSTSATSRSSISPIGTLASVTDLALFAGANALAVEAAPGVWEVLQAGVAELIAPGRYRLSRLLRGQRGTEGAIGNPAPAGARVVVLDEALAPLPVPEAALGLEANWRFGPASKPVADRSYRAARLHAGGRRPAAVLGRPRPAAVAHGARARRSRHRLDPPLARARRRQLDRGRGAARRGARGLRGRDPRRRRRCVRTLADHDDQRRPTPPPSSSPTRARCSVPATRCPSASSSSPPSSGGARRLPSPSVLKHPCPTPAPTSCCRTCSRRRRRSMSPSTRRCGCSTASCSSPCSTGT